MKIVAILIVIFLAGCATQQKVTLLPRGADRTQALGTLDRINNKLTVNLRGQRFEGAMQSTGSTVTRGVYGGVIGTTSGSQYSALLRSADGQIRCDFSFDQMMINATGVCVDYLNTTYDLQIEN